MIIEEYNIGEYKCFIKTGFLDIYTAYVHLPVNHPFIGMNYDTIMDKYERFGNVHGGLTYSVENVFGIDFGHCGDYIPPNLSKEMTILRDMFIPGKKWSIEEIKEELSFLVKLFKEYQ